MISVALCRRSVGGGGGHDSTCDSFRCNLEHGLCDGAFECFAKVDAKVLDVLRCGDAQLTYVLKDVLWGVDAEGGSLLYVNP